MNSTHRWWVTACRRWRGWRGRGLLPCACTTSWRWPNRYTCSPPSPSRKATSRWLSRWLVHWKMMDLFRTTVMWFLAVWPSGLGWVDDPGSNPDQFVFWGHSLVFSRYCGFPRNKNSYWVCNKLWSRKVNLQNLYTIFSNFDSHSLDNIPCPDNGQIDPQLNIFNFSRNIRVN